MSDFDMRAVTACFTGHRRIPAGDISRIRFSIRGAIEISYQREGIRCFYCGGALGFDTYAAEEVIQFRESHPDISLILAIPCGDQDRHWQASDRTRYHSLIQQADSTVVLSPTYYDGCMLQRNRYMVDRSALCICYLRSFHRSGTFSTVRYAAEQHLKLINLAVSDSSDGLILSEPGYMQTSRVEDLWNYTFISPSAKRNANTAILHLSHLRGWRSWKRTSKRSSRK